MEHDDENETERCIVSQVSLVETYLLSLLTQRLKTAGDSIYIIISMLSVHSHFSSLQKKEQRKFVFES